MGPKEQHNTNHKQGFTQKPLFENILEQHILTWNTRKPGTRNNTYLPGTQENLEQGHIKQEHTLTWITHKPETKTQY